MGNNHTIGTTFTKPIFAYPHPNSADMHCPTLGVGWKGVQI